MRQATLDYQRLQDENPAGFAEHLAEGSYLPQEAGSTMSDQETPRRDGLPARGHRGVRPDPGRL
jgi:hypothetical protein